MSTNKAAVTFATFVITTLVCASSLTLANTDQSDGVSKNIFRGTHNHSDGPEFADLVSQIGSISTNTTGLYWRYNLMANRTLHLLTMASRSDPDSSSKILSETADHFLKSLKSELPQTRILAISTLNTLLKESPHKLSAQKLPNFSCDFEENIKSSLERELGQIFQEDGFFSETLTSLSHVHIITRI